MTRALLLLGLLLAMPAVQAKLVVPLPFSDGAVLQRDHAVPVWGWATPGARIEIEFDGHRATAIASPDGAWRTELPAHEAGGPYVLSICEHDGDTVIVRDVLVGDVWLASGQSNMEWPISQAQDAEHEIASASDPGIRHFKIPRSWSGAPEPRLAGGNWQAASPRSVGDFSAVAYAFARELRKRTGVPIGIVDSTWGGSRIEAWMDARALGIDPHALAARMEEVRASDEQALAQTRARLARWPDAADEAQWSQDAFDDADWDALPVPGLWETTGYLGMDGVAWYRTRFELDPIEAAAGVTLGLGMIDDSDEAWVNGSRAGGLANRWNTPREYRIEPEVLRAGRNVLAVRVTDTGGGGGIHGPADLVYVQPRGGTRRPLAATWKFRPAAVTVGVQDDKNQIATLLYNRMIHPLHPYPLRGVIWYQGESNATAEDAFGYRHQFAALIRSWRAAWRQPELPFLWVQLASFHSGADIAEASPWAVLRESQSQALALPATAQVVSIDIGDSHDIHPRNKREVGRRLALAARAVAYGDTLTHSGPVFRAARADSAGVRISFDLQDSALAARGGGRELHGFELAGADDLFHPARAIIDGDAVIASSDAVPRPQAVRYAWRDDPHQADLANRAGLPASPFRAKVTW